MFRNKYSQLRFKALLKLICFILAVSMIGCQEASKASDGPLGLSVEYLRQPEGTSIVDFNPEFAWEVPISAVRQTAYQILVASSQSLLNENKGDVWDTGKVPEGQSIDVEFRGKPLEEGNSYFWKVKIWDIKGQERPFSKIQRFKMGIKEGVITSANHFQVESIKPVVFRKIGQDSYFIDFGKDAFA
ncbi:MAG: hypothetical protein RLP11_22320, partial [Marinoscillum sp.]